MEGEADAAIVGADSDIGQFESIVGSTVAEVGGRIGARAEAIAARHTESSRRDGAFGEVVVASRAEEPELVRCIVREISVVGIGRAIVAPDEKSPVRDSDVKTIARVAIFEDVPLMTIT